jgi:hypothetical protein
MLMIFLFFPCVVMFGYWGTLFYTHTVPKTTVCGMTFYLSTSKQWTFLQRTFHYLRCKKARKSKFVRLIGMQTPHSDYISPCHRLSVSVQSCLLSPLVILDMTQPNTSLLFLLPCLRHIVISAITEQKEQSYNNTSLFFFAKTRCLVVAACDFLESHLLRICNITTDVFRL